MIMKEINLFKKQGFVRFGLSILSKKESEKLSVIVKKIYTSMPRNHPDFVRDLGVAGIKRLPLHDKEILNLINKIVCHSSVKIFLADILGRNYKIWQINFRISKSNDRGLYIHQDGLGEISMIINLDDNFDGEGATAVLPSSHLLKKSQLKLKIKMPRFFTNLFSILFEPLLGARGDIFFLSNKTWHGRFSNLSQENRSVLIIGFLPQGYYCDDGKLPENFIKKNSKLYVSHLLAKLSDYTKGVRCDIRETYNIYTSFDHGYSMHIENYNYLNYKKRPIKLILAVYFFWFSTFLSNFLFACVKFVKLNSFFRS